MRCWWIRLKWECCGGYKALAWESTKETTRSGKQQQFSRNTTHLVQKRLRCYGHVRRRDESHMTRTVLDMEVEGVWPRRRPKLRYMDTIRRDMKKNVLTDINILDLNDWRMAVSRATHWCGRPSRSEGENLMLGDNEGNLYNNGFFTELVLLGINVILSVHSKKECKRMCYFFYVWLYWGLQLGCYMCQVSSSPL